jgi:sugar phosphate isomerase/epimerase
LSVRFGVCSAVEQADATLAAGADYIELPGHPLNEDADYIALLRSLPVEATNLFFSADIGLYDDFTRSVKIARRTIKHAAEAGVQVMVIGSGAARKSPKTRCADWAFMRFVEVVNQANEAALEEGVSLAPESLNREETDVGNDLAQLAESLREVNIGFTADSYHVLKEWDFEGREGGQEAPSEEYWREKIPFAPTHVHLAPLDRQPPRSDDPMLLGFMRRLKESGYDSRISLECACREEDRDVPAAVEAMRTLWEAA